MTITKPRKAKTLKAPKGETLFVVRRHWNDPESETIAVASSYHRAMMEAVTFLMEQGRDYEAFDTVEVDDRGAVVDVLDCVSWEPDAKGGDR